MNHSLLQFFGVQVRGWTGATNAIRIPHASLAMLASREVIEHLQGCAMSIHIEGIHPGRLSKAGRGLFPVFLNRTVPAVLKDGRRELIITAAGLETGPLKKPGRSLCVTTPAAVCHTRVRVRGFWLVAGEPRDTKSAEPRPKEASFQAWLTRKGWLWQPT